MKSEFEGRSDALYMPCIYARNAENVTLSGYGVLNGQGKYWWENSKKLPYGRPYLICFERCRHVKVLDVKLINSPVWTVHPLYCDDAEVRGVTICNPWDSPNTDGINPDGCRNVRIVDCLVDVGDDCITLKSGTEDTPEKRPCENITITNCNMVHGHGGVVIGSEMSGGVFLRPSGNACRKCIHFRLQYLHAGRRKRRISGHDGGFARYGAGRYLHA